MQCKVLVSIVVLVGISDQTLGGVKVPLALELDRLASANQKPAETARPGEIKLPEDYDHSEDLRVKKYFREVSSHMNETLWVSLCGSVNDERHALCFRDPSDRTQAVTVGDLCRWLAEDHLSDPVFAGDPFKDAKGYRKHAIDLAPLLEEAAQGKAPLAACQVKLAERVLAALQLEDDSAARTKAIETTQRFIRRVRETGRPEFSKLGRELPLLKIGQ